MTRSGEAGAAEGRAAGPLDARWRIEAERAQEAALPDGSVVVSCPAPLGVGGLGRHLKEILDALERLQRPRTCVCGSCGWPTSRALRHELRRHGVDAALAPLARFSRAWRMFAQSTDFDTGAAGELPAGEHLLAFNGTALAQFRAARRAGRESNGLVAANSHFRRVVRQHELAYRQYPIERPWVRHLLRRNLAEYQLADRVYVASRYVRESFVEEGFDDSMLSLFPLTPSPRFTPAPAPAPTSETFDVLYVGSLSVHKGVPLLVDAFRRLSHADLRLVLVGGWGTRGMRRFLQRSCAEDARIRVAPGDPLEPLRRAGLCVHMAYEDGFAYAPAEALACGVPVIVSEDTGMKELIDPGANGLILATGDVDALSEAIEAAHAGAMTRGR
jgi:glycosyltransferase involved in cell wall biosynthesis